MKETNHVFPYEVQALCDAISHLEGHAFGPRVRFSTIGYGDQLTLAGREAALENFKNLPGLRELADDLNAAMKPVLAAYAAKLRRELVISCVKLAGAAMKPPTFGR